MAKKNVEAAEQAVEKKARVSVKDRARKHLERISKRGVVPMVFDEVLTAYAAIGVLKYDDAMEMADAYAATFMAERGEQ